MKNCSKLYYVLNEKPNAEAVICGSDKYPNINGKVFFRELCDGVIVHAEISGLPKKCNPFFAFHIHDGTQCTGNRSDPFADAGSHYNPNNCPHPCHAGDMPPLFGANGKAFLVFLTDKFKVCEILGKTVIIHDMSDDFTTQPSGNAGEKIACGIIRPLCR